MVIVCCVPFCKNNGKTPNVSFHNFTKDPKLKKIWIYKIKRDTVKSKRNPRPFHVSKYTKICSAHFIRENFLIKSEKNRLKADAIPSIFPWSTTENATGRKESNRYHVVVDEKVTNPNPPPKDSSHTVNLVINENNESVTVKQEQAQVDVTEPTLDNISDNTETTMDNAISLAASNDECPAIETLPSTTGPQQHIHKGEAEYATLLTSYTDLLVKYHELVINYKCKTATTMKDKATTVCFNNSNNVIGAISDNMLLQRSGFAKILESKLQKGFLMPGDTFLADKGFTATELLKPVNISIPVFRINNVQFSVDEVMQTQNIARERVHVERAIGRLKNYKILASTIPLTTTGTINQIWTVCCLLSNFQMPLRNTGLNTTDN